MRVTVVGAGLAAVKRPGSWPAGVSGDPSGNEARPLFPGPPLCRFCRVGLLQLLEGPAAGFGGRTAKGRDAPVRFGVLGCGGPSPGSCRRGFGRGTVGFSDEVTKAIQSHPLITVEEKMVEEIPEGTVILATGPLTQGKLAQSIGQLVDQQRLAFLTPPPPLSAGKAWIPPLLFMRPGTGKGTGRIT